MDNNTVGEKRSRFSLVISFLLILVFIVLLFILNGRNISKDQLKLDSGWDAAINEKQYQNIALEDFTFDVVGIGDVVTLSHIMPDVGDKATVRFWICHSAIDVFLDEKLIYTYGHEKVDAYKAVGSGFYFVELPRDYAGKRLLIKFSVGEISAFGNIEPIYIEPTATAITSFLSWKLISLLCGGFLVVIGMAGLCASTFVVGRMYKIKQLIYIFQFAILIGIWALCNDGIAQLFIGDYVICQTLEFVSLFMAPVPILLFLRSKDDSKDLLYKCITILICLIQSVCMIAFVCVWLGILHFQHFLMPFHVLFGLTVIQVFVTVLRRLKNRKSEDMYVFAGCIILSVGCMIDVGGFYLKKYLHLYNRDIDFATILGSLVMVMCLVASYFSSVHARIASSTENEVLEKLAYHDMLTGVINRVKYEELLDERDASDEPYAIMYFDLNGLKTMNDSRGHSYGDSLIKEFSICLKNAFQGLGEVARLGGDEFSIILPNVSEAEVNAAVDRMQSYIKQHNDTSEIKLDTAFGIAFSKEAPDKKSRTVNKLADSRMYEMKKEMKTARG